MGKFSNLFNSKAKSIDKQKSEEEEAKKSLFVFGLISFLLLTYGAIILIFGITESPFSITTCLIGVGLLVIGLCILRYRHNVLSKWDRYLALINPKYGSVSLDNIAMQYPIDKEQAIKDIQKMMRAGYYPDAFFDYTNSKFILNSNNPLEEESLMVTINSHEAGSQEPIPPSTINDLTSLISKSQDEDLTTKLRIIFAIYSSICEKASSNSRLISDPDLNKFNDLYLPKTITLVEKYQSISIDTSGPEETMRTNLLNLLDQITNGLMGILTKMTKDEQRNISAGLDALSTMMSVDGYDK